MFRTFEYLPLSVAGCSNASVPSDAKSIFHLAGRVSKRKVGQYRSGPSTNWLKAKCYAIGEFDLLDIEREPGKPAFALMADRKTGRYVGSAFIHSSRAIR